MNLDSLGWTQFFQENFETHAQSGFLPARVALEHREAYVILSETGEQRAVVSAATEQVRARVRQQDTGRESASPSTSIPSFW